MSKKLSGINLLTRVGERKRKKVLKYVTLFDAAPPIYPKILDITGNYERTYMTFSEIGFITRGKE